MIDRLSSREKIFVAAGLLALLAVLLWFALLAPYLNSRAALARRSVALQRTLADVTAAQQQIDQLRQQLATVQGKKRDQRPLFSRLENLTQQVGVRDQLLSMRPQTASVQGKFRQQRVELQLEKLSLPQLMQFLHAVEYRQVGIQVATLRIKPRFDDRTALDANLVLTSLEAL